MPAVRDIAAAIEKWAPPATAQSYDNVGLQIGRAGSEVTRIIVALDLTPDVVDEAVEVGAELIVTHHPLLFRPLKSLTGGDLVGGLALRAAEAGIAVYAAHTNLDAAEGGVSIALAEALGLREVGFLTRLEDSLFKLVTFVPVEHEEAVRVAIAAAGAGRIGNYDACAFAVRGTGYFQPGEGANPFLGSTGRGIQSADEVRLEAEAPRWLLAEVVAALKSAHPYEEVAYDVYPVEQRYSGAGLGAVGHLEHPMTLPSFLSHMCSSLQTPAVRYSGPEDTDISRVAVCGGAGADLIRNAVSAGADAFVTSDVSYHRFFERMDEEGRYDLVLVDAGHYETEAPIERQLAERLSTTFPDLDVRPTRVRTGPVRYYHAP